MLALRIEYLTGRCVATAYNDRDVAEWPPHPSRVFSAMAAAWADVDELSEGERQALEWLECAGAPYIAASGENTRTVVTHFVPVNDLSVVRSYDRVWLKASQAEQVYMEAQRALQRAQQENEPRGLKKAEMHAARACKAFDKAKEKLVARAAEETAWSDKDSKQARDTARRLLPWNRTKQARSFPSVSPDDPVVHLVWEQEPENSIRISLAQLAGRIVRIGHSSSLVTCCVTDNAPEASWFPDEAGQEILRVPGEGQLMRLQEAWEQHQEIEPRVLPCVYQRYRKGTIARPIDRPKGVFDDQDWLVLRRVGGPRLRSTRAVDVAKAVRGALMACGEDPVPPLLSGHSAQGKPLTQPHLAILPLPFVGHKHADGTILGVVLVFPRKVDPAEHRAVLRAMGSWEETYRLEDEEAPIVQVQLGRAGVLELERIAWGEAPLNTLRAGTWSHAARTWVTVTPVALDRNPGNLRSRDHITAEAAYTKAETSLAEACTRIGLPRPRTVTVLPSVSVPGATKAQYWPPFPPEEGKLRRVKVHARITFAEPIRGPVLLGAGRYVGLGLFRPVREREGRS